MKIIATLNQSLHIVSAPYEASIIKKHNTHNINNKEGNSLCQQLLP